jgi:hypothetical protein
MRAAKGRSSRRETRNFAVVVVFLWWDGLVGGWLGIRLWFLMVRLEEIVVELNLLWAVHSNDRTDSFGADRQYL